MPFDPALPATGSALESAVIRSQLVALKTLIDGIVTIVAAQVDGATTLDPGQPATVDVSFDGTDVHFSFGIPRGNDGANGADGPAGPQGDPGPEGPPGEVTQAALDAALATAALNPGGVGPYGGGFSDPPTQGELRDFAAYVESLRAALVR